jgi:hypothetical protein
LNIEPRERNALALCAGLQRFVLVERYRQLPPQVRLIAHDFIQFGGVREQAARR